MRSITAVISAVGQVLDREPVLLENEHVLSETVDRSTGEALAGIVAGMADAYPIEALGGAEPDAGATSTVATATALITLLALLALILSRRAISNRPRP
jgi:hypothetical protein